MHNNCIRQINFTGRILSDVSGIVCPLSDCIRAPYKRSIVNPGGKISVSGDDQQ